MVAPPPAWRQYWIFQATPERFPLTENLREGAQVDWFITRFVAQYREGDVVYLWQSGDSAGFYGWGEIVGEPYEQKDGRQRVAVMCRGVFATPLLRDQLLEATPDFDCLTLLRNPTGSNFRITVDEVSALNQRLESENNATPPEPTQQSSSEGEDFLVAHYLLDYRFDSDVKAVIANTLNSARAINNTVFPKLFIQCALVYINVGLERETPSREILALVDKLPITQLREQLTFASVIIETADYQLKNAMADALLVKHTVIRLLASARRFAVKTSGKEQIALRHLLGAFLHGATESFQSYIQELVSTISLDLPSARQQLLGFVAENYPGDNASAWNLLVAEPLQGKAAEAAFVPLITPLDSDSAEDVSNDYLNIDNDAIALAKILCAKDAAPPLAIGLFGEWGSGKTFFMRRLRSHVNRLTHGLETSDSEAQKVYCGKVAQIWFNAWHYQEGNLWASMVNQVFSGLKQELRRLNKNTAESEFSALMKRLDSDRIHERELQLSAQQLRSLNDKSLQLSNEIAVLRGGVESEPAQTAVSDVPLVVIDALQKYRNDIAKIFGRPGLADDLNHVAESSRKLHDFLVLWYRASWRERMARWLRFLRAAPGYLLVTLLVLVMCAWGAKVMMIDQAWMAGGGMTLVSLTTGAVAAFFSRFGKIVRLMRQLKADFERVEKDAQQQIDDRLKTLRTELQKNQLALQQAQQRYDKLNADYGRGTDEAFASFVFSRAASEDYTSQLGLLNTVRRDFSRLNELLLEQKDARLPKLNRIVLYIDDLDRCEPKVVVEVLQAVHLMLAFPLFMVVVGVDARWLGRSLKEFYPFLIHEKAETVPVQAHAASTHDYLEKIIQIPFWLQPLDADRAGGMLQKILRGNQPVPAPSKTFSEEPRVTAPSDSTVTNDLFDESEDQAPDYQESELMANARRDDSLMTASLTSSDALQIGEQELQFISALGGLVGRSPRAVKRFVNLYRILKASQPRAQVAGFTDAEGEFRLPLLLLAALCGYPREAQDWFKRIAAAGDDATTAQLLPAEVSPFRTALNTLFEKQHFDVTRLKGWVVPVARFGYREWHR